MYHNLNFREIEFIIIFGIYIRTLSEPSVLLAMQRVLRPGGGGGGGYSHFFSAYAGLGPACTVHPHII